ncbi:methylated-DNA--[protein]-cysteine S-methyltransferase [Bosea minatitlanensis]|uniref:Methylated-DNA--[protein]-cysteine S-methyltransferase n=1 Tax=Bosea minatitlanensis TaxID=128782 RepID=A0ABW0F0R8_9HYPH|nr:methylated-DNA--[protein]-cysteine S-methyltransferase [Bosea minatitlanensis]MCT4491975.1 methylated-DNA--[protein]-cysteine S-methyltransferase [Bosea minatitlanensis]
MATQHFHLFETAIGVCALAWEGERFIGAQLPEGDEAGARRRLARRFPAAAEAGAQGFVAEAVAGIRALFTGEAIDLSHLPLAIETVPAFNRRVYEVALSIPPGETLTYGAVAQRIGEPGAARAVGVALGQNPWPIIVPCHRVLAAGGGTGGFSADGGIETKLRILTIEKARTSAEPSLFGALPLAARPARG